MDTIVTGIFAMESNAESAMRELLQAGVPTDDLSYIAMNSEMEVTEEVRAEGEEKDMGERIGEGALTGGAVGALAGLAVAAGVITGLGSVFVAGPLAAALGLTGGAATTVAGATTGAVIGGLVGALTGLGIAREDAETYEERVRAGEVLVVVGVRDAAEIDAVKEILQDHNADEVRAYGENRG